MCRFIFVNCCLIWLSKHYKCKNICHIIYFFNNTIIVQVKYIIIETNEFARIGNNGFLFPHSYSGDGLGATHLGHHLSTNTEKKTAISITVRFFCVNCTVSYAYIYIHILFFNSIILNLVSKTFVSFFLFYFHGISMYAFQIF
jgi:hypothetical protein